MSHYRHRPTRIRSRVGSLIVRRRVFGSLVAAVTGLAVLLGVGGFASASPAPPHAAHSPHASLADLGSVRAVQAQFHGLWSIYSDPERAAVLNRLRAAGVTTIRMDLSWVMLQPHGRGSYDPWGVAETDRVIRMANQRGIKVLMTLWLTPAWANRGHGQRVLPPNPADYAAVARWCAARWRGKVVGWEIWNEQNNRRFMAGADAASYVRLLRPAYRAIKAGDPYAWVVFGGLEYNDTAWLASAYRAGAHGYFDAMATHPFQGVADLDPATPDDGTKYTLAHAASIHDLMTRHGDGDKPIWFTEFGWSTHSTPGSSANWLRGVPEALQATYLVRAARFVGQNMPYVTRMFWYSDRDLSTGDVQYRNYGLFRRDLSSKPALGALAAVNAIARRLGGASSAGSRTAAAGTTTGTSTGTNTGTNTGARTGARTGTTAGAGTGTTTGVGADADPHPNASTRGTAGSTGTARGANTRAHRAAAANAPRPVGMTASSDSVNANRIVAGRFTAAF